MVECEFEEQAEYLAKGAVGLDERVEVGDEGPVFFLEALYSDLAEQEGLEEVGVADGDDEPVVLLVDRYEQVGAVEEADALVELVRGGYLGEGRVEGQQLMQMDALVVSEAGCRCECDETVDGGLELEEEVGVGNKEGSGGGGGEELCDEFEEEVDERVVEEGLRGESDEVLCLDLQVAELDEYLLGAVQLHVELFAEVP